MRTTNLTRGGAVVLAMIATASWAQNYLLNGGFDTPNPSLTIPPFSVVWTGQYAGPTSSAADWSIYNTFSGTTTTELEHSTDPLGSGYMLHVIASAAGEGVYQVFAEESGVNTFVDVEVVSGAMILIAEGPGMSVINYVTASTSTIGPQWVTLEVPNSDNENEVFIGSLGPATFYLDNAAVTPVPEPSTLSLWAAAAALIPVVRRTRRLKG
jgi:hypothetical protein